MTVKEKIHEIGIAYNKIDAVLKDTDIDLWAYKYLEDALVHLEFYFEEQEI